MEKIILLVDDQRDILRLLHSTIDTLKRKDLKIIEAPSGEEALLASSRNRIDLLVSDYMLPGMSGVELMHKVRARNPEAAVMFITGMTQRKMREEMLQAGAFAIFDKPIPLADFLDAIERGLGLAQTIFPAQQDQAPAEHPARVSDLLANFRQDIRAEAVFLLNERGLVQARTGNLRDASLEVSLTSTLMAIHDASLKVARHNHQENIDSYHIFSGGDHDLLFIPVTPQYALLVAGSGMATEARILETVNALLALRAQVEKSLKVLGVSAELDAPAPAPAVTEAAPAPAPAEPVVPDAPPAPEMEALFKKATVEKKASAADDFWDQAAQKMGNVSSNPDVISLEDARRLGILPGDKS